MTAPIKPYKHVVFDFDGVLCDSLAAAIAEFNLLAKTTFPTLPVIRNQDDMVEVYGGSLKTCLARWLGPQDHRRFFDAHSSAMAARARAGELDLFAGIRALLDSMKPGSASIVTSAYSDAVRTILERDGDMPTAIAQIAGRELRRSKTDKIVDLLASHGLTPTDAIYVGDLESDILYCRDVPIDVIAVGYGYHPEWHLRTLNPTFVAVTVKDLHGLLESTLQVVAVTPLKMRRAGFPSRA